MERFGFVSGNDEMPADAPDISVVPLNDWNDNLPLNYEMDDE